MAALAAPVRRVTSFLFTSAAAVPLFVVVFVVAGVVLVLTDFTINDEGLLTHYWASWLRRDFVPIFFFQKAKPVVCVLYAAISAAGPQATLIAHVVVAATSIPMLAATARALGYRLPNLPALTLAVSPLYFYGAAAGLSNVDGVTGIVLTLYLLCARRQPLAAGLVLGLLLWVRFELAVFYAVMAVYALATRGQRSMLLGMVVFPLIYVATGAAYHGDALWVVHFPPAAPFDPDNPLYVRNTQLLGLRYLLEPAAALTPAAALAVALPFARLRPIERALLVYAALVALTMNILPVFHIGNFGASPRYMLHLLPALALFVGRAMEPLWEGERPGPGLLLGAALVGLWVATRQQDSRAAAILISIYAVVLAAAWVRAGTLALAAVIGLVLAGPLMPLRTDMGPPRYLAPMLAWLRAHPERGADPIYTNAQLLAPYLVRRLPGADVYYMAGGDMSREKGILINADNGQLARMQKLSDTEFFTKSLFSPFTPDDLPDNALLVLRVDDHRLSQLLPDATWSPHLEVIAETPDYRIARFRQSAAAADS